MYNFDIWTSVGTGTLLTQNIFKKLSEKRWFWISNMMDERYVDTPRFSSPF